MNDHEITLEFIHPTDSAETLTATVTRGSTPQFLIDQLVDQGFLVPPDQAGEYRLVDLKTGKQLLPNATLADIGISEGAKLQVDPAVTGA